MKTIKNHLLILTCLTIAKNMYADITPAQLANTAIVIRQSTDVATAQKALFKTYEIARNNNSQASDYHLAQLVKFATTFWENKKWPGSKFIDFDEYKAQKDSPPTKKPTIKVKIQTYTEKLQKDLTALSPTNPTTARKYLSLYTSFKARTKNPIPSDLLEKYKTAQTLVSNAYKKLSQATGPETQFISDIVAHIQELKLLALDALRNEKLTKTVKSQTGLDLYDVLQKEVFDFQSVLYTPNTD